MGTNITLGQEKSINTPTSSWNRDTLAMNRSIGMGAEAAWCRADHVVTALLSQGSLVPTAKQQTKLRSSSRLS